MLEKLTARIKNLFRRRRIDTEVDDELRFHVEMETAANRDRGLSADEARRAALRDLGGVTQTREAVGGVRTEWWRAMAGDVWQDARYSVRVLRRSSGFTLVAVLVLSLGIGINTALFSVVNALFFRTIPVERPEELVYLAENMASGEMWAVVGPLDQDFIRNRGADVLDFTSHWSVTQTLTVDDETQLANGEWVEHNYFDVLGVKPILGRALSSAEDDPASTEHAILISHDLWTRRFKADPSAVGQRVRLRDHFATVVGVMPRGFHGLSDPWTPTQYWAGLQELEQFSLRRRYSDGPIGRMKPGVTFAQVQAFAAAQTAALRQSHLDELVAARVDSRFLEDARRFRLEAYRSVDVDIPLRPETRLVPIGVMAAVTTVVALVLIIATANITGLLLARGMTRSGELAVRRALGAAAPRLLRQLLTESVVLSLIGGALGLFVSANLIWLFQKYSPSKYVVDVGLDWRVLAFAAAVCLGAGLLVGLGPAMQAVRINVLEALGQGITGGRRIRARLRHWIVVPQVALSLVLLLVAGVHVRSLMSVELADLGYRPANTIVITVNRWEPRATSDAWMRMTAEQRRKSDEDDAAKYRAFSRALLAKLDGIGQISAFGLGDTLPLRSSASEPKLVMPDSGPPGQPASASVSQSVVSDAYFAAMGITLRQGRTFDGRDALSGVRVAIISADLARHLWPVGDAVGHSISFVPQGNAKVEWLQIIGVVNDVEPILHGAHPGARVYISLLQQWRAWAPYLVVRTAGTPRADLVQQIRSAVVGADAFAEVRQVQTMTQMVEEILYPRRIASGILLVAGLIGLGLACVGLYGVVSYSVAQRLREIGIRATLGASRQDIIGLVLREGVSVVGAGTVAGFVLSVTALKLTAGLIPGVPLGDPLTFVIAPLTLGLVVLAACYLPARRAAGVDPISVLRES